MTTITEKIIVHSNDGDSDYPCTLDIRMDATQMDCPVTFYQEEKPVFSMAAAEIPAFCAALSAMDCSA
jgi:hypothetical protein